MLLIGDSTMLAIDRYDAYRALRGFEYVFDAKSCRTLGIPSCGKRPLPPNAVEAINHSKGTFDDVVIMAGYDEWWTSFPQSFDEVVAAARAKGARKIIWLTYREGVPYKLLTGERADEAFIKNNQTLRDKVASGDFPDVELAKWYPHAPTHIGWLTEDGIHLTVKGASGPGRLHLPLGGACRRPPVSDAGHARGRDRTGVLESRSASAGRRPHRAVPEVTTSRRATSA